MGTRNGALPPSGQEGRVLEAWRRLEAGAADTARVELVDKSPRGARLIHRLTGIRPDGRAVIAKKCPAVTAWIERSIYEEILPALPVPAPGYHGFVEEADGSGWLFIEDVGGERFSPHREDHRALAGEWLGAMHTAAARVPTAARLPERGPGHYLAMLRSARAAIEQKRADLRITPGDRAVLENVLRRCDDLEAAWAQVEACCDGVPATLVHGDFRRKNVFVRERGAAGAELLPIDWDRAGWGVPAADLAPSRIRYAAHVDLERYGEIVRASWPGMELPVLERLMQVGIAFRRLVGLYWETLSLSSEGTHDAIEVMAVYDAELAEVMKRLAIGRAQGVK